ncbi:MAG: hypothetical protein AABX11_07780 [Nanoarchaeota archaeon]
MVTALRVKKNELEGMLVFNSIESKRQCSDIISELKWERYCPKKK